MTSPDKLPEILRTEAEVDELMARPSQALIEMMGRLKGDIACR